MPAEVAGRSATRHVVLTDGYVGLSDLAADPSGQLWALPERQRALLPLRLGGGPLSGLAGPARPIEGVPAALDTEALAWVDAETLLMGTESNAWRRRQDLILIAHVGPQAVRVVDQLAVDWGRWGVRARRNEGIEGICYAQGVVLAALETPFTRPDGRRVAALGHLDWAGRQLTPLWLPLHTPDGRISALSCRGDGQGGLVLWAIERHYGVAKLLQAAVPAAPLPLATLDSRPWWDLGADAADVPNYEGLAPGPDGRVWLLTDNHTGRVTGPTWAVSVPAPAPPAPGDGSRPLGGP